MGAPRHGVRVTRLHTWHSRGHIVLRLLSSSLLSCSGHGAARDGGAAERPRAVRRLALCLSLPLSLYERRTRTHTDARPYSLSLSLSLFLLYRKVPWKLNATRRANLRQRVAGVKDVIEAIRTAAPIKALVKHTAPVLHGPHLKENA